MHRHTYQETHNKSHNIFTRKLFYFVIMLSFLSISFYFILVDTDTKHHHFAYRHYSIYPSHRSYSWKTIILLLMAIIFFHFYVTYSRKYDNLCRYVCMLFAGSVSAFFTSSSSSSTSWNCPNQCWCLFVCVCVLFAFEYRVHL